MFPFNNNYINSDSESPNTPSTSPSNSSNSSNSTDNSFLIPSLRPILLSNILFNNYSINYISPFQIHVSHSPNPRMAPYDNIRRFYQAITDISENQTYKGEWKNGKRDGLGNLLIGDSVKFIGNFREDKISGFGKLEHSMGKYKGFWRNFLAVGVGEYIKNIREMGRYIGYWKNNKQNIFGIENYNNLGMKYTGQYKNGVKEGIGVFQFKEGAKYEGEFKMQKMEGVGTYSSVDNQVYQGEWRRNNMNGYGMIFWPNGNRFEGEFFEDKKEGFGVFFSGSKIFMGVWENNLLEGNVIVVEENKIKKQFWKNGKPLKILDKDTFIYFEKFVDNVKEENKMGKKNQVNKNK